MIRASTMILLSLTLVVAQADEFWIGLATRAPGQDVTLENPMGEFGWSHTLHENGVGRISIFAEHKSGLFAVEENSGYNAAGIRFYVTY